MIQHATLLLSIAIACGAFMAWGIGANDVSNAMGTSVGARALTMKQAVCVAAIFELSGCLLAGGQVTHTIRHDIINPTIFAAQPQLLVYGMIAALLAAACWLLLASNRGWPVSTTHTIVGAIIGFALLDIGGKAVDWSEVIGIVSSWVVSPLIAGCIAFVVFTSIQRLIFNAPDPFKRAKKIAPFYIFFVGFVVSMVTINTGLKHLHIAISFIDSLPLSAVVGVILAILGGLLLRRIKPGAGKRFSHFNDVEKVFAVLMLFSACTMAFAHGSNDVANAIGPLAAVVNIIKTASISSHAGLPFWVLLLGGVGIVVGLATYGYKVMATIGKQITELTPSRGFSAEISAASTIVLASGTGLPVSTTQVLVGAVFGVGFARGIGALNLRVIRNIFMSWVITLPAGALLAALFYWLLKLTFG